MKTVLVILIILILLFLAAVLYLAAYIVTGNKRMTLEEAMAWQSARCDTSFYSSVEKTDYTVAGYRDYILHVQLLKNPEPTSRYVIITHGFTDNRIGSLKYVPLYFTCGFNCLIYDIRGHGLNKKTFTTYSLYESRDLLRVIEDTRNRYPDLTRLSLHGESLGAASTVAALNAKPPVDFAVEDCGFSDIENVIRGVFRSMHIPQFIFAFADLGVRLLYHCSLKEMRPIDALDGNEIPVLFIHGSSDTLIAPKNAQDMYDRTCGEKDLFFVEGANHAVSVFVDPDGYLDVLRAFISRFL